MALTVVKLEKAAQMQQQNASVARNYRISEVPSSQNAIIKVTKSNVQQRARSLPTTQYVQTVKRSRPVVVDDGSPIVVTTKKMASANRQAIPVHSVQSSSSSSASAARNTGGISRGNIVDVSHKLLVNSGGASGIKFKPGTTLKITSGNKQYTTTIPFVSSNGALNIPSPTIISASSATAGASVQQQQRQQHQQQRQQQHQQQRQQHHQQQQIRRPTILIKSPPKRTIRTMTMELIDKSPKYYLGITSERLSILKSTLCQIANIPLEDLYMTLRKLRLNESFRVLSEYFEYPIISKDDITSPPPVVATSSTTNYSAISGCIVDDFNCYSEIINVFTRTIRRLSKYLIYLIRWPDGKKYYDRHKNIPISYRLNLSLVQSLVDCVETEIQPPLSTTTLTKFLYGYGNKNQNEQQQQLYTIQFPMELKSYKFVLSITPNGIITYVSDVCCGYFDDITVFRACEFHEHIPNYLTLVSDPGPALRRIKKFEKNYKKVMNRKSTGTDNQRSSLSHDDNDNNDGNKEKNSATTTTSIITKGTETIVVTTSTDEKSKANKSNNKSKMNNTNNPNASIESDDHRTVDDGNENDVDENDVDEEDDDEDGGDDDDDDNDDDEDNIQNENEDIDQNNELQRMKSQSKPLSRTKLLKNYIPSSNNTMRINVETNQLQSSCTDDFKIATVNLNLLNINNNNNSNLNNKNKNKNNARILLRSQITNTLLLMREYKIIQPFNTLEPQLYSIMHEILITISALVNLQR